jgi:predicted phage terminase large subunit-like protein
MPDPIQPPIKRKPGRPKKRTRDELLLDRFDAVLRSETDLIEFTKLMRPDANDPDDPHRSTYAPARHHRAVAAAFEELVKGTYKRLILTLPPRHGKTELVTKHGIAHFAGRFPDKSVVFGTYNENYAEDIGRAVRDIFRSPQFKQVFPKFDLKDGSEASNRLETTRNGLLSFVGRGGTITGRGGDILVIDDPVKDAKEANSPAIRTQLWEWWVKTLRTRCMTDDARVLIVQTRWHEDDLVGRLTDAGNDFYDEEEAAQWKIINIPALADENDPLGRAPGEPLWPERFGVQYLKNMRRTDPRGFEALYQGRPTPEGGAFFQDEWFKEYRSHELPTNLRYYAASDHAVSMEQGRDKTCLMVVGVDERDNIYVLPDLVWRQMATDQTVEHMLRLIRKFNPMFWWAGKDHIAKSIGPFLRKRMAEESTFAAIVEVVPIGDKRARAQSIHGRMSMGRVFFPKFAPWWAEARSELLRFPGGAHDDLVDTLALIGLGLATQLSASHRQQLRNQHRTGTFGELFARSNEERAERARAAALKGW